MENELFLGIDINRKSQNLVSLNNAKDCLDIDLYIQGELKSANGSNKMNTTHKDSIVGIKQIIDGGQDIIYRIKVVPETYTYLSGIAISGLNMYLLDIGANKIYISNLQGEIQSSFGSTGSGNGQFDFDIGVTNGNLVVHTDNKIYVADTGNSRIQIFSLAGAYENQFNVGAGLSMPTGISISSADEIYIMDQGLGLVVVTNLTGTLQRTFTPDATTGDDIKVYTDGRVYMPENGCITCYTSTGTQVWQTRISTGDTGDTVGVYRDRIVSFDPLSSQFVVLDLNGNIMFRKTYTSLDYPERLYFHTDNKLYISDVVLKITDIRELNID